MYIALNLQAPILMCFWDFRQNVEKSKVNEFQRVYSKLSTDREEKTDSTQVLSLLSRVKRLLIKFDGFSVEVLFIVNLRHSRYQIIILEKQK